MKTAIRDGARLTALGVLAAACSAEPEPEADKSSAALGVCPLGSIVIVGTPGPDVLIGTRFADCILGLGGDDRIVGKGGPDVLLGGDGNDVIEGGAWADLIFGGDGNDQISGGGGLDFVDAGDGNDIMVGGPNSDLMIGNSGNDVLRGEGGFDFLFGDAGSDVLLPGADGGSVEGGDGLDYCTGSGCERPAPNPDSCQPPALGQTCTSFPCCSVLGLPMQCMADSDCTDDGEPCTDQVCQPAVGCQTSVNPTCTECPIGWQASAVAPVFFGQRDYGTAEGAPGPARVFFPSLDGSPSFAPPLLGCGRYPLVLLAHGNCTGDGTSQHYQSWFVASTLARAGYVVVVPALPVTESGGTGPWENSNPDLTRIGNTLTWMRTQWELSGMLRPGSIGIMGHSFGSLLAARFASENAGTENAISAYVSLSGVWGDWPSSPPRPINSLTIPKLFVWGTGDSDVQANLNSGLWSSVPAPKHQAVLTAAEHFDYLRPFDSACADPAQGAERGPCASSDILARELVFTFFGKYLPPENAEAALTGLPNSLKLPPLSLTQEQEFFAGLHRIAADLYQGSSECRASLAWQASSSGNASFP
jgi:alpha/beta superfamily hydrolase